MTSLESPAHVDTKSLQMKPLCSAPSSARIRERRAQKRATMVATRGIAIADDNPRLNAWSHRLTLRFH